MPAAFHQRRGSLTMFFRPILQSVRQARADAIAVAEAGGVLRGK
jgi:hypothetical protein